MEITKELYKDFIKSIRFEKKNGLSIVDDYKTIKSLKAKKYKIKFKVEENECKEIEETREIKCIGCGQFIKMPYGVNIECEYCGEANLYPRVIESEIDGKTYGEKEINNNEFKYRIELIENILQLIKNQ